MVLIYLVGFAKCSVISYFNCHLLRCLNGYLVGWLLSLARRRKEYSLKIQAVQFKKVMLKHDREIVQHKGTGGEFVEPPHYLQKQVLRLSPVLFAGCESLLVLTSQEGCS